MVGQVVIYGMLDGSVQIATPQIGDRLVAGTDFNGASETFNPAAPAFNALRPFTAEIASGAFIDANVTWAESETDFIARRAAFDAPASAVSTTIMQVANTPRVKRLFRNAWKLNGSVVDVDLPKARVIHLDRIREARNVELVKADVALERAVDNNDTPEQNRQRARRRLLRNLPATTDLSGATTAAELDAIWPSDLPARP